MEKSRERLAHATVESEDATLIFRPLRPVEKQSASQVFRSEKLVLLQLDGLNPSSLKQPFSI
jgi:hypothetical protein